MLRGLRAIALRERENCRESYRERDTQNRADEPYRFCRIEPVIPTPSTSEVTSIAGATRSSPERTSHHLSQSPESLPILVRRWHAGSVGADSHLPSNTSSATVGK